MDFAQGFGTPNSVQYENDTYKVVTGLPPHSNGDFVYLTYLIVNKANGMVENFNNILRGAKDQADGMHKYTVSPAPETKPPQGQQTLNWN